MSKKSDLVFDNVDEFLKANPNLAITKPVPNTAAIRAILRAGGTLNGVKLVEAELPSQPAASHGAQAATEQPPKTAPVSSEGKKSAFHEKLHSHQA